MLNLLWKETVLNEGLLSCSCINGTRVVSDSTSSAIEHIFIGKRTRLSLTCLGLIAEQLRLELFVVKESQIDCSQDCLEPIIRHLL